MKKTLLLVAILAALSGAAGAALRANPAFVGLVGALAFAAIATWAGAVAVALEAPDALREPRHPRGPSPPAQEVITRPAVFGRLWAIALGAFALAGIVPLVALGRRPRRAGTAWTRGARLVTPEGRLLRPSDTELGGIVTVFPEGHIGAAESAVVLIRVEDDLVESPPERRDWVQHGNVAFSKICTHAGCPVAIYRHADYRLYCPCHQSEFSVVFRAAPVSGPATRALPQLGLDVGPDGYLRARGDFAEPVGPDEWWRPA